MNNNKKTILIIAVLAIIGSTIFYLYNKNQVKSTAIPETSLRLSWIPSASFSGEIVGMSYFDSINGINLKCEEGGPGVNPIQAVISGQNTFGTIAADEVFSAIDKGADLVIIGVINYYSPGGFVSLENSNIKTPKDFENKKIGLLPFGSTTLLYENLIRKNNVNKNLITEIVISPDMKSFIEKKYDVHPVFVYDETVSLDNQNIKYNLIEPKNFGVELIGPVYFCKRETLLKSPKLVESFVKTMADGWNFAIKNQDKSIDLLYQFSKTIDKEREIEVLAKAIPYFTAFNKQPINCDNISFDKLNALLYDNKVIAKKVNLEKHLNLTFINSYYK